MKPAPFTWHAPSDSAHALALKAEYGEDARFLAGGQSLVPAMNLRMAQPAVVIDLNLLDDLRGLAATETGGLRIGAMTRYAAIERSPAMASHPILREALAGLAHPQIRNRGTLGGNLAHADPASEMPALMCALLAEFVVWSVRGRRTIAARDFFIGPLTTALAPDEMMAEIQIPPLPPGSGTAFLKMSRRRGDYALMGIAAMVTRDADGRCLDARLACCSAGPTPVVAGQAAAALVGRSIGHHELVAAAACLRQEIDPMGSVHATPAYQRHLAGVLAARAVRLAWERAA